MTSSLPPIAALRDACTTIAEEASREIMRIYAGDLGARDKADKSPVTDGPRRGGGHPGGAAQAHPRHRHHRRGGNGGRPRPDAAGRPALLAGRSARRHQGVHQEERRVHGEHRADRECAPDPRHRAGAGHRNNVARGQRTGRRQERRWWCLHGDPHPYAPEPGTDRLRESQPRDLQRPRHLVPQQQPHRGRPRPGRIVAEVLPDRGGQGRHLSAVRADQRMGYGRGAGCARSGEVVTTDDRPLLYGKPRFSNPHFIARSLAAR